MLSAHLLGGLVVARGAHFIDMLRTYTTMVRVDGHVLPILVQSTVDFDTFEITLVIVER